MVPAKLPARCASRDYDAVGPGAPGRSLGLNKRRKPPPPPVDLEAMKPQQGVKREWRNLFPLAVPGTGSVFMPARSKSRDGEDEKSARGSLNIWSCGKAYSSSARASFIAEGLLERAGTAVRGWMRGSRESLVSRMLGEGGGESVLPIVAKDRDGDCVDSWQIHLENWRS